MKDFSGKLLKAAEFILGMIGVAMILIETYSVFCRNVTHWSTPWVDEVLRLMFVWIVFVGAAIAYRSDDLISLTLVEDKWKEKKKILPHNVIKMIQYIIALIISVILVGQQWTTMQGQIKTGEATQITGYPLWVRSCGILVGFILLAIIALLKIIKLARTFKTLEAAKQ